MRLQKSVVCSSGDAAHFIQLDLTRVRTYFTSWLIRMNSYEVSRAKTYDSHVKTTTKPNPKFTGVKANRTKTYKCGRRISTRKICINSREIALFYHSSHALSVQVRVK